MKIPKNIIISFLEDEFGNIKYSGNEIRINSPLYNDRKYHFYVNAEKGVWHDFREGAGGSLIDFISDHLSLSYKETIKYLITTYYKGQDKEEVVEELAEKKELVIPEGIYYFKDLDSGLVYEQAISYLRKRKIPEAKIQKLGFIYKNSSPFHKTIFIPFIENGKLIYFITRDFSGYSKIRYKNPEGFDSKEFVYNIDNINGGTLFIFEGIFDSMMLENQVGTALLSADISDRQIKKIIQKNVKKVVFVVDKDDTGRKTLLRNVNLFKQYAFDIEFYVYDNYEGKDFNESGMHYIDEGKCRLFNKTSEIINNIVLK